MKKAVIKKELAKTMAKKSKQHNKTVLNEFLEKWDFRWDRTNRIKVYLWVIFKMKKEESVKLVKLNLKKGDMKINFNRHLTV